MKATIAPENASNKDITWSSTNPEVATVDSNGKVKALSVGKAEIVAKSNNGKEAKCSINVWGLELRMRTEEGEEEQKFSIKTTSSLKLEYKKHKENGNVDSDWSSIDFPSNYWSSELSNDKSKIKLYFYVDEFNEESSQSSESDNQGYFGSILLDVEDNIRDVSDIDSSSYFKKVSTDSSGQPITDENGDLVYVEDTGKQIVRGVIIGPVSCAGDTSKDLCEILIKDKDTDAVYGIRNNSNTDYTIFGAYGTYEKGYEVLLEVAQRKNTYTNSQVLNKLILTNSSKPFIMSTGNSVDLDISKATVLDSAKNISDLFDTNEQRVESVYKLFTFPAGNKYHAAHYQSNPYYHVMACGGGIDSLGEENYKPGYELASGSLTREYIPVNKSFDENGKVTQYNTLGFRFSKFNSELVFGSPSFVYEKIFETTDPSLAYLPYRHKSYVGKEYDYVTNTETGETEKRTIVGSLEDNNEDFFTSKKSVTFMFLGLSLSPSGMADARNNVYNKTSCVVLDASWIR